jgi:hypothetical protein
VLDGYDRYAFPQFDAIADSTVELSQVLSKRTASLRIDSEPQGASFVLGAGRWRGTTPFALTDVEYGAHVLRVENQDYNVWERTIEVPYPNNEIVVTLERLPDGYFEIQVRPVAAVYLDGDLVTSEIQNVVFPARPGRHVLELRFGDSVYSDIFELPPGDTITIQHTFVN